jgi:hypothetical protein
MSAWCQNWLVIKLKQTKLYTQFSSQFIKENISPHWQKHCNF